MKRLIPVVTIGTLLVVGNAAFADPPATPDEKTQLQASRSMPGAMINDIVVPYEVMIYVETEYPGHTVTDADKVTRSGTKGLRLRIDNDIYANERESVYLFYDAKWKLIEEEKITAPPVQPKPSPKPDSTEEDEDKPERNNEDNRGGGNDKPEPEEKPEESEPSDDNTDNTPVTDSTGDSDG